MDTREIEIPPFPPQPDPADAEFPAAAAAVDTGVYKAVFDTSPDGIMIVDEAGIYIDVNESMARMLKTTRDDLVGQKFGRFIPPDRTKDAEAAFASLKETGRFVGEFPMLTADGDLVDVEWHSQANFVTGLHVCIARDVSERKEIASGLRHSEERLRLALKAGAMGVWDWNIRTGRVQWSEQVYALHGRKPYEFLGTVASFMECVHPEDRDRVGKQIAQAVDAGAAFHTELRVVWPNGAVRWIATDAETVIDASGQASRMVGVTFDITHRKETEERLLQQAEDLWRTNKELEQFAYVSSHDLKEPLRKVSSYTHLLEMKLHGHLDRQAHQYLNQITTSTVRMNNLIEDLLAYSRLGYECGKEDVDASQIFQDVTIDLETAIRDSGAQVTADPLPVLQVRKRHLHQLLQNLIGNAIKFRGDLPPRVHLSVKTANGHHNFRLRDNGIGIDPKYHTQIFKVFQRLHSKNAYPGTGIGLAICKKIVELYGGTISVESVEGTGSIFHFTWPERLPLSRPTVI